MRDLLLIVAVLGAPALVFVLWPFFGRRRGGALLPLPLDRRQQLLDDKRAALRALRELEFEHEAGHISDADYAGLRARYEAEAAAILTELDRLAAPAEAPPLARPPAPGRSAWRHPAALAAGAVLLVVFGAALGAGIVRYSEPDTTAGMSPPGPRPLADIGPGPAAGPAGPAAPAGPGRAIPPEVLRGMLQAARASLQAGRYGEAIAAYQAVLKRDPQNVDALTHLGLIVAIGGHADQALATFDRALGIDPNYAPALLYRGQVLLESKQDAAGAIRAWEKFVAIVPPGEERDRVLRLIDEARARPPGRGP